MGHQMAMCERHPERPAVAACVVCDKPLCPECAREAGGRWYCAEHTPHVHAGVAAPQARVRPGALAAVAAVVGAAWGILYMLGPAAKEAASLSSSEVSKMRVQEVAAGLDDFRRDVGRYPTEEEGLAGLLAAPPAERQRWLGPYVPAAYVKDGAVVDALGRPIRYRVTAEGHFVVGVGADGKIGTKDDIELRLEGRTATPARALPLKGLALPAPRTR